MKQLLLLSALLFSLAHICAQTTTYTVLPSQANPNITRNNDSNYIVIDTTVPRLNKLFLFFPGTGATPRGYQYILRTAAELGYDAIGLSYVNDTEAAILCAGQGTYCNGEERMEVFYGQDFSPVISVDSADGIRTRLLDILKYLNASYPAYGWGQYLYSADSVNWSSVCVSGHSQGAGMASIIAYWFLVDRGVFFATGGDWYGTTTTAWMEQPSNTPPSHKFAFTHRQDELFWGTKDYAPGIWDTLGLYEYGLYISVDTLTSDFYGAHAFTSNLVINSTDSIIYHNCVVTDNLTPFQGGLPLYQPVWQYMLSDTTSYTDSTTGIADITDQGFVSVYPNPFYDQLIIKCPELGNGAALLISDELGREMYNAGVNSPVTAIDASAWQSGVYFVSLKYGGASHISKAIKW